MFTSIDSPAGAATGGNPFFGPCSGAKVCSGAGIGPRRAQRGLKGGKVGKVGNPLSGPRSGAQIFLKGRREAASPLAEIAEMRKFRGPVAAGLAAVRQVD